MHKALFSQHEPHLLPLCILLLQRIKSFLMDESTTAPLVVHGNRGSGNSILALSEKLSKIWLAKTPKLVLR
ncbi:hypothetical protein DPMN_002499 [Dreissena polymorpha]|uniref:Uncharacterized protein n=1 Tax=Dreissena polymorpha TaxID=45954 RepID=A0A9D4EHI3_DREPO|nr:hypothetical protein DPMN_193415 [Dreissena polymorpha]KAH3780759.1 hypothetical protein DPMN_158581 [Dreissena polymorpha]KAH3878602.1 hypothetical protein DPMN_002499 [Dreissena polymorpha]